MPWLNVTARLVHEVVYGLTAGVSQLFAFGLVVALRLSSGSLDGQLGCVGDRLATSEEADSVVRRPRRALGRKKLPIWHGGVLPTTPERTVGLRAAELNHRGRKCTVGSEPLLAQLG